MPLVCTCTAVDSDTMVSLVRTNVYTLSAQLGACFLDLCHQFLVCFGDVVEGEDTPAELEEEICAEGYEGPERELGSGKYVKDPWGALELTTGTISF